MGNKYITISTRGVGSFEKFGGPCSEGHFSKKKRALNLFFFGDLPPPPPPVAKKISVSVPFMGSKKFSGHTVLPKYKKIFPEITHNFHDISHFPPKF